MRMNLRVTGYYLMLIYNGNVWTYDAETKHWVEGLAGTAKPTACEAGDLMTEALRKGQNKPFVADNWGRAAA